MMIVKRRSDRVAAAKIVKEAQIKKARTLSVADFKMVAKKFCSAVHLLRNAMKSVGSKDFSNYDQFFGGFEQCDIMLQDPLYWKSTDAQRYYTLLMGANDWLKHEADKLGEMYVSPNHFYYAWWVAERIWLKPDEPPPVDI